MGTKKLKQSVCLTFRGGMSQLFLDFVFIYTKKKTIFFSAEYPIPHSSSTSGQSSSGLILGWWQYSPLPKHPWAEHVTLWMCGAWERPTCCSPGEDYWWQSDCRGLSVWPLGDLRAIFSQVSCPTHLTQSLVPLFGGWQNYCTSDLGTQEGVGRGAHVQETQLL